MECGRRSWETAGFEQPSIIHGWLASSWFPRALPSFSRNVQSFAPRNLVQIVPSKDVADSGTVAFIVLRKGCNHKHQGKTEYSTSLSKPLNWTWHEIHKFVKVSFSPGLVMCNLLASHPPTDPTSHPKDPWMYLAHKCGPTGIMLGSPAGMMACYFHTLD